MKGVLFCFFFQGLVWLVNSLLQIFCCFHGEVMFSLAVFFLEQIFIMKENFIATDNTGDIQQGTELCPMSLWHTENECQSLKPEDWA